MAMLKLLRSTSELLPEQVVQLRKEVVGSLTVETEAVYGQVSHVILEFAMYTHNGTKLQCFPCTVCTKELEEQTGVLNEQNTVLVVLLN